MNEEFAAKVDPLVLYVLDLLDRIKSGRGGDPLPERERPRLKQYLGQLDVDEGGSRDIELTKKALVYWIDEMLVHSSWSQAKTWENRLLEFEVYGTRDRGILFFERSNEAKALTRSDALTVFFLCAALGFVGRYRGLKSSPSARTPTPTPTPNMGVTWPESSAPRNEDQTWGGGGATSGRDPSRESGAARDTGRALPATLEDWARPIFAQIVPEGSVRNFEPKAPVEAQNDARPLYGARVWRQSLYYLSIMVGVTLAVVTFTWVWGG